MSQLQVMDINIPGVLIKLRTKEWLIPQFQREFVWNNAQVIALANSVIDARPVGMVTLWEQSADAPLPLEPISIADWDPKENATGQKTYADDCSVPGRYYAILDGRQRSTALALTFGGLRASSAIYRHAGGYFLDVTATEDSERVKFVPQKEMVKRNLHTHAGAIGNGYFPLGTDDPNAMMGQWMVYLQDINKAEYYPGGALPHDEELKRRNAALSKAFSGIFNTKMAVYIVPPTYDLAQICEIFDTLNTTGTKVSTIDLIHSGLFNDTVGDAGGALLLRDEIDAIGELDGAVGWSSSTGRPELIAQFVAAIHVALDAKPEPKRIGGAKDTRITSVKSSDLLAIPSAFWRKVIENNLTFASFIGGFQNTIAGGRFTMAQCPYPASAAIYVALRWHLEFEGGAATHWTVADLDRLYGAFFWRNVFHSRYDQGFLTQIGTDLREMKAFLSKKQLGVDELDWRKQANEWLDFNVGTRPNQIDIFEVVSDGGEKGALRRAALLLLHARADRDVISAELSIALEGGMMDLHHIYPKDWCKNNAGGVARDVLDRERAGRDWVSSAANLMPMHRQTNNEWRKQSPATFLHGKADFDSHPNLWTRYYINRDAYDLLLLGEDGVAEFWKKRASAMAEDIYSRTTA
ncbi:DUF262 domain-containing protein [Mesorhizobium sp. B261B1A]|uniref:GmrSD restriction endonuclease domain-containing protein n=1 Tax=Mesorhizobium sp. B261B1A TaxID=2876671 RepID=UPI001CD0FE9B|nr:DUF262 domain-containing protein [Mesorhizobium sp. B261B1A]MCA0058041.1 DUF262 domain-containing protein [Mesorhizobium sp. B261B1A]